MRKLRINITEMLLYVTPDQIKAIAANANKLFVPGKKSSDYYMVIAGIDLANPDEISCHF